MSVEAPVCCSPVLSVDDGVTDTGGVRRSTIREGADNAGVDRAFGGGGVGSGLGPLLTDRTVETGLDSSFTAARCCAGARSLLVVVGSGNTFGSAFTDACAEALRSGTGIGLTGEDVNTFEYA